MLTHTIYSSSLPSTRALTLSPRPHTGITSSLMINSHSSLVPHLLGFNAFSSNLPLSPVICLASKKGFSKSSTSSTSSSSKGGSEGSAKSDESKTTYRTWDVRARHGGFKNMDGKLLHSKMMPLPEDSEIQTVQIQLKDIARLVKAISKYRNDIPLSVKATFWSVIDDGEQLEFTKSDLSNLFPGDMLPETPSQTQARVVDAAFVEGYEPVKKVKTGPQWEENASFLADLQSAATEDQSQYVTIGEDRKGQVLSLYAPYSENIPDFLMLQKAQGSLMERGYTQLYKTHNSILLELHVLGSLENFGPAYFGPQGESVIALLNFVQRVPESIHIFSLTAHGTPSTEFKLCDDHDTLIDEHESFGALLRKGPDSASAAARVLASDTNIPDEVKDTVMKDGLLAALSGLGGDSFSNARSWIKEAVSERIDATRSVGTIYPSLPGWLKKSIVDYADHRTKVKSFMSMVATRIKATYPEEGSAVRRSMEKGEPALRAHLLACGTDVWRLVFTETSAFVEPGTKVRSLIDTKMEEAREAGWMVSDLNVLRAQYETEAANVIRSSLLESVGNDQNRAPALGKLPAKIQNLLRSTTASREDLSIRELYASLALDFSPFNPNLA